MGDVAVRLVAADTRRASALSHALGELPEARVRAAVTLRFVRDEPTLPVRPPDVQSAQLRLWFRGAALTAAERSGMIAQVANGEVQVGGSSFDPTGAFHRLLLSVLTHAMHPLGRFVLHAAALDAGGSGWLVLGASGQGKSTTSYAAHLAGWSLLDDDLSLLRARTDRDVDIAGLGGRPVALPGELLDPAARDGARGEPADVRDRRRLQDLRSRGGWAPLAGCIVVGHGEHPRGSLSPLAPAQAISELLKAYPGTINSHLLPSFFALAAPLARKPAFQILQGRDPAERVRDVQNHLQEIIARCSGREPTGSPASTAAHPAMQTHH